MQPNDSTSPDVQGHSVSCDPSITNHVPSPPPTPSKGTKLAPILHLPNEIFHLIISYLDVKDIITLAKTNRALKALLLDDPDGVWRILCRRDLYVTDTVPPPPYASFWDLYVHAVTPFHWIKTSLWIGDSIPFGDVYLTKYDRQTGSLALFKLLCRSSDPLTNVNEGVERNGQDNQQQPRQHVHVHVSTSVFLQATANNNNNAAAQAGGEAAAAAAAAPPQQQNRSVVRRINIHEPTRGRGGHQTRQLPSDPDITVFPEQGCAIVFGPYICLNKFTERDPSTGMWKFQFRSDNDNESTVGNDAAGARENNNSSPNHRVYNGPHMGLLRAVAMPNNLLDRRMSVWPPFTIPARNRTRNASVNNFLGHYEPPPNAVNIGGGVAGALARAEAAHAATLAAFARNRHMQHQIYPGVPENHVDGELDLPEIEGLEGFMVGPGARLGPAGPGPAAPDGQQNPDQPRQITRTRTVVTRLPDGRVEMRTENGDGNVIHITTTDGNANAQNIGIVGNAGAIPPNVPGFNIALGQVNAPVRREENHAAPLQNQQPDNQDVPAVQPQRLVPAPQAPPQQIHHVLQIPHIQIPPLPDMPPAAQAAHTRALQFHAEQIARAHQRMRELHNQNHDNQNQGPVQNIPQVPQVPQIPHIVPNDHNTNDTYRQALQLAQANWQGDNGVQEFEIRNEDNEANNDNPNIPQAEPVSARAIVNGQNIDDTQHQPSANSIVDENVENRESINGSLTEGNSNSAIESNVNSPLISPAPTPPNFVPPCPDIFRIQRFMGRVHGKVETLFRLTEDLYTPTYTCPYRGIWVSSRSFEILLFHQPRPEVLEAIKLTGGTHVRRGEYNFIVSDMTRTLPIAYPEWPGARILEAKCQVSEFNFTNPRYQDMEIIVVNPNKVVLHCKAHKLMDVCKRVEIENLLKTEVDLQRLDE